RRHTRSKRDWSSDVCSSDLRVFLFGAAAGGADEEDPVEALLVGGVARGQARLDIIAESAESGLFAGGVGRLGGVAFGLLPDPGEIGRASCRERGGRAEGAGW